MAAHSIRGSDHGTLIGAVRLSAEGGCDAQAFRFEAIIGSRAVGLTGNVTHCAGPARIEGSFFGWSSGTRVLCIATGPAVLADELAGIVSPTVDLPRLKIGVTQDFAAACVKRCKALPPDR
jgi:hypothetical protein